MASGSDSSSSEERDELWYPRPEDIIFVDEMCLSLTGDPHPHRLLGSKEGLEAIIQEVRRAKAKGLTYQAALLMQRLVKYHAFAGGNHRTAYVSARLFLSRNGRRFKISNFEEAYPFIMAIRDRTIDEVQRWIEHGTT